MEQKVIIRNNNLLFHISELPFHLLKINNLFKPTGKVH